MVVPSADRLAPSFVEKGYTLPICPHGGNNDSWDSLRASHPRSEAASPKIRPSKRRLGWLEQAELIIDVQKKLSQLLGLTPDETEMDESE